MISCVYRQKLRIHIYIPKAKYITTQNKHNISSLCEQKR